MIITTFVIVIVFVGFMGLLIGLLSRSGDDSNSNTKLLTASPSDSTLIGIKMPSTVTNGEEGPRREGYTLNDKPFAKGDYDYEKNTKDFRLVCTRPCPVATAVLDQEFAAINHAVSTVRGLTGSDIDSEYLPFEVHASEDSVCPIIPEGIAYASLFRDRNGYSRGKLCFFFDKIEYDRTRFPYSTSVHEVVHLFEYGKLRRDSVLYEGLAEMMESFFLKGNERNSFCWSGNKWWLSLLGINPEDPHDVGRDLFFELCKQYGFDYDDLPSLFGQLDDYGGNVGGSDFARIVNDIVGKDTSELFRKAGVI